MHGLRLALLYALVSIAPSLRAEAVLIEPQTQGTVSFISSGLENADQDTVRRLWADYNLSLIFSETVAAESRQAVAVRIEDAQGRVCLQTAVDGHLLFVKLKPDRYNVIVEQAGRRLNKSAKIVGSQKISLSFNWTNADRH